MPSILYQYRSNITTFNILESNAIRMSDIQKTNDFSEMRLFYPDIFTEALNAYNANPFSLEFDNQNNEAAIMRLNYVTYGIFNRAYRDGEYSNYAACFCEDGDSLDLWRGYGADGKGCSLGYDYSELNALISESKGILRLYNVHYIDELEKKDLLVAIAETMMDNFRNTIEMLRDNPNVNQNENQDINTLIGFNYWLAVKVAFNMSLQYKVKAFSSEREWRILLSDQAYKKPEYVITNMRPDRFVGSYLFLDTCNFLKDKIKFTPKDDNLCTYIELSPQKENNCLKEIIVGPKNKTNYQDFQLFLLQNGYKNVTLKKSFIPYC